MYNFIDNDLIDIDFTRFNNIILKNKLLKFNNDVSMFQLKISDSTKQNYLYELNKIFKNKNAIWSKHSCFNKNKKKNNLLFMIDDKMTDVFLIDDTNKTPREHWEQKHYEFGIVELKLIGRFSIDKGILWNKIFGYQKTFPRQGKYQRIVKDYKIIKQNIKQYFKLNV